VALQSNKRAPDRACDAVAVTTVHQQLGCPTCDTQMGGTGLIKG